MRKAKPKKRQILPDPVFNDKKVSKFVNHLMYDGKKSISYEIFYNALESFIYFELFILKSDYTIFIKSNCTQKSAESEKSA